MKTNKFTAIILLSLISFTSVSAKEKQNQFSGALDTISSWLGTLDTEKLIEMIPDNSHGNQMICVGSNKHMQFTDFIEAADTSKVLKTLIDRYNLITVTPDSIPDSLSDYYYYFKMVKAYPFFTVLNSNGDLISGGDLGYSTPERLVALVMLSEADLKPAGKEEIRQEFRKIYNKNQRKLNSSMSFYDMMSKGRHVDVSVGYGLYTLSGKSQTGNYGILSADIGFRQDISDNHKVRICTGIGLDHVFDAPAQTRLSIPFETELVVSKGYPQIKCRAGIWGGRTFVKQQFSSDYIKYEAGAACSLIARFGSFDFSLGYKRGLTDRLTSSDLTGYSNSFTLSIRLMFFD